jgi:hypothetical protein
MKSKRQKSLRLAKETLRSLSPSELRGVEGAEGNMRSGPVATICGLTCLTCTTYQGSPPG